MKLEDGTGVGVAVGGTLAVTFSAWLRRNISCIKVLHLCTSLYMCTKLLYSKYNYNYMYGHAWDVAEKKTDFFFFKIFNIL